MRQPINCSIFHLMHEHLVRCSTFRKSALAFHTSTLYCSQKRHTETERKKKFQLCERIAHVSIDKRELFLLHRMPRTAYFALDPRGARTSAFMYAHEFKNNTDHLTVLQLGMQSSLRCSSGPSFWYGVYKFRLKGLKRETPFNVTCKIIFLTRVCCSFGVT